MYIWKTNALAEDIKNKLVGQNEWKKYYLAVSIFVTAAIYLAILSPRTNLVAVLVEVVAVIGILIIGVNITYRSNGGDTGVDYIPRITALSLPVVVKLYFFTLLIGILIAIWIEAASLPQKAIMDWVTVGLAIFIQAAFFWRINIHIKNINT